jgi:hypothetical protein
VQLSCPPADNGFAKDAGTRASLLLKGEAEVDHRPPQR